MIDEQRAPTLGETLEGLTNSMNKQLRTSALAQIVKVDLDANLASVQLLNKRNMNGVVGLVPIIQDLPVIFPNTENFTITYPYAVGDFCIVLFMDRSIDEVSISGKITMPKDLRHHSLNDGLVLVGFNPTDKPIQAVVDDGISIRNREGSTSVTVHDDKITSKVDDSSTTLDNSSYTVKIAGQTVLKLEASSSTISCSGSSILTVSGSGTTTTGIVRATSDVIVSTTGTSLISHIHIGGTIQSLTGIPV